MTVRVCEVVLVGVEEPVPVYDEDPVREEELVRVREPVRELEAVPEREADAVQVREPVAWPPSPP